MVSMLFFFFFPSRCSQQGHMTGHEEKTSCAFVIHALTSLVKKYGRWKNSSYLFVGVSESPFLETAHAIPLGLFFTFFFFYAHVFFSFSCSCIFALLILCPIRPHFHSLILVFFCSSSPLSALKRHQAHISYQITDPLLSVSLPAEPGVTGGDVDGSERGQMQSEHRTAVILSASLCSWPRFKLKIPD